MSNSNSGMNDKVGATARTFALEDASGTKILSLTWHRDSDVIRRLRSESKAVDSNSRFYSSAISVLGPTLSALPAVATAIKAHGTQLMEVVIDGKLAKAAGGQGYRGFSIAKGVIDNHALLLDPTLLLSLVDASAVFGLVSAIVGQKHLADISASLKRIEGQLDRIAQHLDRQELADVQSIAMTLQDYYLVAQNGPLPERSKAYLENIYQSLSKHFRVWLTNAQNSLNEVKTAKYWEFLSTDNQSNQVFQDIETRVARLVFCVSTYELALRVDASQAISPEEWDLLRTRERDLDQFINAIDALQHDFASVSDRISANTQHIQTSSNSSARRVGRGLIGGFSPIVLLGGHPDEHIQNHQIEKNIALGHEVTRLKGLVGESVRELRSGLKHFQNFDPQLQSAQRFLIEYQNGVPVAAYHAVGGRTY